MRFPPVSSSLSLCIRSALCGIFYFGFYYVFFYIYISFYQKVVTSFYKIVATSYLKFSTHCILFICLSLFILCICAYDSYCLFSIKPLHPYDSIGLYIILETFRCVFLDTSLLLIRIFRICNIFPPPFLF